jgi:hypothetical protein
MIALWPKGFVGHKWEEDRRIRRGSLSGALNATDHLRRGSSGFFRHTHPSQVPLHPTLDSMPHG